MKRYLLAAALAAFSVPALAADLPVKVRPLTNILGAGYTGSGFYAGINFGGGGGNVNTSIPTIGGSNLVDLQALIGITVGYAWTMSPTQWIAIEGDFDIMNLSTSGTGLPLTLNGPMDFEQRFIYGFPLQSFLAMLPVQLSGLNLQLPPFPVLPSGVTATNAHMYVFAGIDEKDISANFGAASNKVWLISPEIGIGNRVQLTNGMAQDVSAFVQFDSKGTCVGNTMGLGCGNLGMQYGLKYKLIY